MCIHPIVYYNDKPFLSEHHRSDLGGSTSDNINSSDQRSHDNSQDGNNNINEAKSVDNNNNNNNNNNNINNNDDEIDWEGIVLENEFREFLAQRLKHDENLD